MKKYLVMAVCMMLGAALFGCGKKSGLEGKLVDGKGKPIVGAKVVAKQVQPIKGYEQFECTTGTDGVFKFDKLFPTSSYELITYPDGTNRNLSIKAESGPEKQTKTLNEPIKIRFLCSKDNSAALDTVTGLMWAKNANISGKQMNWNEATEWAKGLDLGGYRNWRLPSKEELEQLAKSAGDNKPAEYFNSIGFDNVQANDGYWSQNFYSSYGGVFAYAVSMKDSRVGDLNILGNLHVWPVRSGQ